VEPYEDVLTSGGKTNSLGRADEVIADVYANPTRLDELFECISADDPWVRMRAIDSFEKIIKSKPEWVQPYLGRIFGHLTRSPQPSVQWHLAQLFSEVTLTNEQQKSAIDWLKARLRTTDIDWIVSVNIMRALVYFYRNGLVAARDLRPLFTTQEGHSSKTVRKKAAEFKQVITPAI